MAVYKVPQDVEAEDKLLGPFSFKQFIFLIITVMTLGMAYALSQILLPLALIPLPISLFFGALALPLRKDQPMEVYLAAVISFLLKPKVRLWQPDGIESLIEVIAPKVDERLYGKGYSQEEVHKRLSYLANIVDSRGWSVRGSTEPENSMNIDLYNEAQSIDDLMDDSGARAQKINMLLEKNDAERKQLLMAQMHQQSQLPPQVTQQPVQQMPMQTPSVYSNPEQIYPATPNVSPIYTPMTIVQPADPYESIRLEVNPYPKMNQSMIQPLSEQIPQQQPAPVEQNTQSVQTQPETTQISPQPQTETASEEQISPAIIDLAKNHDNLSVATLQREAERIKKRELEESEEIVISLR